MNAPARLYLEAFLAPLAPYLARPEVTDLYINRPGELWLETAGGIEAIATPALDDAALWRLARQIAAASHQAISREHPLLAATLPDGARVQVCAPPATRGHVALAVRKHRVPDLTLADYVRADAFGRLGEAAAAARAADADLARRLASRDIAGFLAAAVRARKTILIAGGTSTGKTTFLNALLKEAPRAERLILIEDTPEIMLAHPNAVGLVAVRGQLGEAAVTADLLLEAALRLRPDRIVVGEIRGREALAWLRAVGSGHPGSITTIHAGSAREAVEQMALMALQAGTELGRAELIAQVASAVDIHVQLGRAGGRRVVEDIAFTPKA